MNRIDSKDQKKQILSAKISEQAADGWQQFCAMHKISLSAFLEAAGRDLAAETMPPGQAARWRMIDTSRVIDSERRSRA